MAVKFSQIAVLAGNPTATDYVLMTTSSNTVDSLVTPPKLTTALSLFGSAAQGVVSASGGGTTNFLRADGSWQPVPGASGANPTATASDVAVNGVATTWMRSDAAPAVQKTSAAVFGLCKVDGTTITAAAGVISAAPGTLTVGTSTITGGVSGNFLYDNAGVLGERGAAATTAVLVQFSPTTQGVVPLSGGGSTNFLRADGSWTQVAFTNLSGTATSGQLPADVLYRDVSTTTTVGYLFTSFNGGTISTGTFTPAAANGNYQYYTNNGAHTFAAPAADSAMDVLMTNGASAVIPTFTGFTIGASTGDAITATNTSKFIISVRRINAISTYTVKALQ